MIARGLDDEAHVHDDTHAPMRAMGDLLTALAGAVRALGGEVLGTAAAPGLAAALESVRTQRARCVAVGVPARPYRP